MRKYACKEVSFEWSPGFLFCPQMTAWTAETNPKRLLYGGARLIKVTLLEEN